MADQGRNTEECDLKALLALAEDPKLAQLADRAPQPLRDEFRENSQAFIKRYKELEEVNNQVAMKEAMLEEVKSSHKARSDACLQLIEQMKWALRPEEWHRAYALNRARSIRDACLVVAHSSAPVDAAPAYLVDRATSA